MIGRTGDASPVSPVVVTPLPKTLGFLSVRHAFVRHAFERQSFCARFRHEGVGVQKQF